MLSINERLQAASGLIYVLLSLLWILITSLMLV
jgi:hypothetical protein